MPIERRLGFVIALFLLLGGCATTATVLDPLPPRAVVVPSFVPDDATVILRFGGRATRETAIAEDIARMIAVSGTWSTLSAGSDADPIADVDIMLCAAHATIREQGFFIAARWYFVFRHTHTHAEVEQRIARIGEVQGVPVTWNQRNGLRYANLPVSRGGFAPHIVLLSSVGELVIAPASDLERVLEVAGLQARARRGDEAVDPWLRPDPDELVFLRVSPDDGPVPSLSGMPPARSLELRARHDAGPTDGEIRIRVDLEYTDAAVAQAAHTHADTLLRQASENVMIGLTPIGPVLRATTLETDDVGLTANVTLNMQRARSLAHFLTQIQGR